LLLWTPSDAGKNATPQLGVGVRVGTEAIVHPARAFIASASPFHALVKLDFSNTFNTVRRDCIFDSVATHLPSLYFIFSYEMPLSLLHGNKDDGNLHSAEVVQQGDPLGLLLLCLCISEALTQSKCTFTAGYL